MHGTKHGPGNVTTPRAPVCPGSHTQLQGGKPGAFRADTSLLQGVTPLGASPEGLFGTLAENRLLAHPLLCFLAQKPRRKSHAGAENCKVMTAVAPRVATLHRGDPVAQGSRVLPWPSLQQGRLPSHAHRQLPLEKGMATGRGPRPSCSPCQPCHTQRWALATPMEQLPRSPAPR